MAKVELSNTSASKFVDISSEDYRVYTFPGGVEVVITSPQWLSVSEGGHRVLDAREVSHYIPKGWIHLEWKGKPHFVK